MNLYQPTISGSFTVLGSSTFYGNVTISGSVSATSSVAISSSYATSASNADFLDGLDSTYFVPSSSYATMSSSLSTRVTKIEGNYATTGSNAFNGSQNITGSLTVSQAVIAQTLNVQQVTSSIVYSSGSNVFGNQLTNVQQMTGSVSVTGSLTVTNTTYLQGSGSNILNVSGSTGIVLSANDKNFLAASYNSSTLLSMLTVTGSVVAIGANQSNFYWYYSGSTLVDPGALIVRDASTAASGNPSLILQRGFPGVNGDWKIQNSGGFLQFTDGWDAGKICDWRATSSLILYNGIGDAPGSATFFGNVGIGVTSLISPGASRKLLQISNSTNGAQIALGSSTSESENPRVFSGQYDLGFAAGVTTGTLQFYTNDTQRMLLTSGGSLQITGSIYVSGSVYSTGTSSLHVSKIDGTGGTTSSFGPYKIHTYTTTGNSSFTASLAGNIEILVVGGGGSGGGFYGGGGGAGGVVYYRSFPVSANTAYTVTVGAGGTGVAGISGNSGNSGNNSTFGTTIIAYGGGGGGSEGATTGKDGGSGGGAALVNSKTGIGWGYNNQGNPGGIGYDSGAGGVAAGGGGGGFFEPGQPRSGTVAGAGGRGIYYDISGTLTAYAGGGGGGYGNGGTAGGAGGVGGGGAGANGSANATAGTANTGGGGGGAGNGGNSGAGGSGIVIIRYLA